MYLYNKPFDNWDKRFCEVLAKYQKTGNLECVDCGKTMQLDAEEYHVCEQCGFTLDIKYCINVWLRNKSMATTSQD